MEERDPEAGAESCDLAASLITPSSATNIRHVCVVPGIRRFQFASVSIQKCPVCFFTRFTLTQQTCSTKRQGFSLLLKKCCFYIFIFSYKFSELSNWKKKMFPTPKRSFLKKNWSFLYKCIIVNISNWKIHTNFTKFTNDNLVSDYSDKWKNIAPL